MKPASGDQAAKPIVAALHALPTVHAPLFAVSTDMQARLMLDVML